MALLMDLRPGHIAGFYLVVWIRTDGMYKEQMTMTVTLYIHHHDPVTQMAALDYRK